MTIYADIYSVNSNPAIPIIFTENSGTATPAANNLNILGGTGISTSGSGSTVTINFTGGELGTWTDEGVNFNAAAGNGYFITASCIATMPASPTQGQTIAFTVDSASTVTITANTGQTLRIGSVVSASAGTATNNARGDSVTFVYRSSDTSWVSSGVIGTWILT